MSPFPDPVPPPQESSAAPRGHRHKRRLRRIREYQREALANPDALLSNVALLNGDLMKLAHHLTSALDASLAHSPGVLDDFLGYVAALDKSAQLAKLIERFAQFEARLRKSTAANPPVAPARPPTPLAGAKEGEEAAC